MTTSLNFASIYNDWFKLKNRDPYNYVNNKDFFFYAIIASHIFFFWFIASIFDNYEHIYYNYGDWGKAITIINDIVIGLIGFLILIYIFNRESNQIYPLLGIIFILYLINMAMVIFTFDRQEIDPRYEKDPTYIAYSFLISYAFVSYFIC
jgi:TRAP-type uncharacterized transport system fused permease subunit